MKTNYINEETYKKGNRKLFTIQIILLFVWIACVIGGVCFILFSNYWTIIPGIAMIAMPTILIGTIELMLYLVRHQRGIQAYQASAVTPLVNEFAEETSEAQRAVAKNFTEGINEANSNSGICYCKDCGSKNFIDAKFCQSCGKEIKRL